MCLSGIDKFCTFKKTSVMRFIFFLVGCSLVSAVISQNDLPWYNDCNVADCSTWVFDNGASIVGSPWEDIDLNFECSTDGPAGPYNQWAGGTGNFTAALPMNSTTNDNGLLIVDSDLYGADASYDADWIENCWVQTAQPINCSGSEFVRLSFETRYYCWDEGPSEDGEKCLIEVSRDGINWPDISTFEESAGTVDYGDGWPVPSRWEVFPDFGTHDSTWDVYPNDDDIGETGNPTIIQFDISSAAGDQDQIWIRFRWSGTWGFSWEIDDIRVTEIHQNDLSISNTLSAANYDLGAIPISQASSLQAFADLQNQGQNTQFNVQLGLSIDGDFVSNSSPTNIGPYPNWISASTDYSLSNYLPGNYSLEFSVEGEDSDEYPLDNLFVRNIQVTDFQLGRESGSMIEPFPQYIDGYQQGYIAMNPFVMPEEATIYGIDVAIVAGSQHGSLIQGYLFDPNDEDFLSAQYGGLVESTNLQALDSSVVNSGEEDEIVWYTLTFENPYFVEAGQAIAIAFEHFHPYGELGVQIWESDFESETCYYFGCRNSCQWQKATRIPMLRINLDPNAISTGFGGCIDETACNFNPLATYDDNSCTVPGCFDPEAWNYNPDAGCVEECVYLIYNCISIGEEAWGGEAIGLFPDWQDAMVGVDWSGEWVFNIPEMVEEPQSGVDYGVHHVEWTNIQGLPEWVESSEYELGDLPPSSQHCIVASGIPTESGLSEVTATGEVFISIFGEEFSIGEQVFTAFLNVVDNPNPIPGCMYATAMNYLSYADYDDGSCLFAGCTDESAGNYSPLATIDDGSCGEPCSTSGESSCATDVNYDGAVNVSDLLLLLSDFGANCE